jgi:membrane protease YdiL (CAAX protease family)
MDAPTAGILRDVTLLVWLALLIGAAAYKWVRQTRPSSGWNYDGNVDVRPFITVDAIVVAALSILLLGGLQNFIAGLDSGPAEAVPAMELRVDSLFISIVGQLMICGLLLFYLRGLRNLNPVELFGFRRLSAKKVLEYSLLFMIPTIIVVLGVSAGVQQWLQSFWPSLSSQESVEAFRRSTDPIAKGMLVIAAVIVAPLVEETIFRGFIYGVIKRFTDKYFAAICSSIIFAVVHLHIGSLIPLTVLAILLCVAYEWTGSLTVPMAMHGLFNATNVALMIFYPEATNGNAG